MQNSKLSLVNNQPIGVLDSGAGGLSILKEIIKKLPKESVDYIADSKNCPYGVKSESEILKLSRRLVRFLLSNKVKLIVLACNTITVSALAKLRREYPDIPIIGTVPVVKTASEKTKSKRIGILSTVRTAQSRYQKDLIRKFVGDCAVINRGTDLFVPLIEKGSFNNSMTIRAELKPFIDEKVDVLVLGCSHFPLIKNQIKAIMGDKVNVLDSGEAIARQVERVLRLNNALAKGRSRYKFFTTGDPAQFNRTAEEFINLKNAEAEYVPL